MQKSKFDITNENLYLVLMLFNDGKVPDAFIIPTVEWNKPDGMFGDRNYDK